MTSLILRAAKGSPLNFAELDGNFTFLQNEILAIYSGTTSMLANINGGTIDNANIGSVTPNAGAFTLLSSSGMATLAGMTTANAQITGGSISGVSLTMDSLNNTPIGSTTPSTGAFTTLTTTGNLGLGVVPSAWGSGFKALQITSSAAIMANGAAATQYIANAYYNGTNFIYQNTSAATYYQQASGVQSWWIAPSGTAGNTATFTQAMTLDASGNFLVGPAAIGAQNSNSLLFQPTASGGLTINKPSGSGSGNPYATFAYNGSAIGSITQNGTTAVLYNTTSDYRLKDQVVNIPASEAIARLTALRPVDFTWVSDGSADAGFIAHEFQNVYARNVVGVKDAVDGDGNPIYQQMDKSAAVPDLVAAVSYLSQQVTALQARLTAAGIA